MGHRRSTQCTESGEDVRFTIMDNSSQDGAEELEEDSRSIGIEFRQSGFVASEQQENSHGEALRQFVMENPECEYYLLLDADLCFIMAETVDTLVNEITDCDDVWAVHARSRRSTTHLFKPRQPRRQDLSEYQSQKMVDRRRIYLHLLQPKPQTEPSGKLAEPPEINYDKLEDQPVKTVVGSARPRCEPCCTLVRNTPVYRRVADRIGFNRAWMLGNTIESAGGYDTMGLITAVMTTHEQVYLESSIGASALSAPDRS